MITHFTAADSFQNLIHSDNLVLLDFYADWCEPCKWLDQILAEVDANLGGKLKIVKINTDRHVDLTHQFGLRSVPVLMIFRKGELLWRMNGFQTASEMTDTIRSFSRETS